MATQLRLVKGVDPLDRLWYNKPERLHVREFGALFGAIFYAIAAVSIYKHDLSTRAGIYFGIGLVFASLGYLAPRVLHPVWKGWMYLAEKIAIVTTFILLLVSWTLMLIPMAIIVRLFKIRRMNMDYRAPVETYWEDRASSLHDFKLLEKQF